MEPNQTPKNNTKVLLGTLVIVLILLGVLMYTNKKMMYQENQTPQEQPTVTDVQTEQIQTQSTSDDVTSIEADLESTDIDSLDL